MKTLERHITLISEDTYKAAKVATYLYLEFGYVLDELCSGESNGTLSIYRKVENMEYSSELDFIFDLNEIEADTAQIAQTIMTQSRRYFRREYSNSLFLSRMAYPFRKR